MLSDDIGQLLQDYFAWAKTNAPDDIGYPHIETVRRLLGSSVRSVGLSDDEAAQVDHALAYIKAEDPECYSVLIKVYRDGRSLRWLEANNQGDRRTNALLASRGTQFIRGALFGAAIEKSGGTTLHGSTSGW